MVIRAHLQSADGQRSALRRALRLDTSGRLSDGIEANVTVHNISAAGLLLETAVELEVNEQLAIDLPEAGAVDAVIVWRSQQLYGCAFEQALGTGVLAAMQLRSGPVPDFSPAFPNMPPANMAVGGAAFGAKLNRLRRERGLTLADVAGALGVSKPTVWAWEKGKARPLPDRLQTIADALGVGLEELHTATGMSQEANALIEDCRTQIATALNILPAAVRIMIEL